MNGYVDNGESGFGLELIAFIAILIFVVLGVYVFLINPFVEKKNYIKMEIRRSAGEEKLYWEHELVKLYYSGIPVIGRIICRKHKHRNGREKVAVGSEQICNVCKTGKTQLELDSGQTFCRYIHLHKDNTCPMFEPITETDRYSDETSVQ
ncbi:MAG: hypothetical protein IJ300_03960 [Clostridia bacterium]|nr:hypothetical protein [Clostridia bacterium]